MPTLLRTSKDPFVRALVRGAASGVAGGVVGVDARDKRRAAKTAYGVGLVASAALHWWWMVATLGFLATFWAYLAASNCYDRKTRADHHLVVIGLRIDSVSMSHDDYDYLDRWERRPVAEGHARYDPRLLYRWTGEALPVSLLVTFLRRGVSDADLWAYVKARRGSQVRSGIELVASLAPPLAPCAEVG